MPVKVPGSQRPRVVTFGIQMEVIGVNNLTIAFGLKSL